MKKVLLGIGILVICINLLAFSPGRDMQPVITAGDSTERDTALINPYTETVKSYTDVRGIDIYNNSLNVRVGLHGESTTDTGAFWTCPSSSLGFEKDGVKWDTLELRLRGDSVANSDTGTISIIIYKK